MTEPDKQENQDLARLLLEHRDMLFSYIMMLVRDWNSAEELFQEISLVILKKSAEGTEVVRDFGKWSREIARRTILNFWKTRKRHDALPLETTALEAIEDVMAQRESKSPRMSEHLQKLNRCLELLPKRLRKLIDLRFKEDMPFAAIGKLIGKTAGAAQVMLSRLRMRLLDCVQRTQEA